MKKKIGLCILTIVLFLFLLAGYGFGRYYTIIVNDKGTLELIVSDFNMQRTIRVIHRALGNVDVSDAETITLSLQSAGVRGAIQAELLESLDDFNRTHSPGADLLRLEIISEDNKTYHIHIGSLAFGIREDGSRILSVVDIIGVESEMQIYNREWSNFSVVDMSDPLENVDFDVENSAKIIYEVLNLNRPEDGRIVLARLAQLELPIQGIINANEVIELTDIEDDRILDIETEDNRYFRLFLCRNYGIRIVVDLKTDETIYTRTW